MGEAPEVRRVPVATGVSLHVLVWRPGDEPAAAPTSFLLLHGLASNCRTWEAVAARLHARGHPVAAVDLRGHGQSDKPDGGYDFATLVDDVLAVATALGFEPPVVAGQSTGGNVAVEVAARAPERVSAVVGVDGGGFELQRRWPEWDDCCAALAPPHLEGTPVDVLEARLRDQHPGWSDAGIAATLANYEVRPDNTIRPWLTRDRHLCILRSLWEHRPSAVLPRLEVPLLLVLAERDDDWPTSRREEAAAAEAAGPHVRVEWLAGDHDLHVDRPDAVADLLAGARP